MIHLKHKNYLSNSKHARGARSQGHSERGFTMAAFLVVLTIGLIFMAIAAPSVIKESQREREEEMLWRGHQIAIALSKHAGLRNGQMPNDLKDLVEGITVGVRKTRLLRPHALCDPMVPCEPGEMNWKTVHSGDPLIKDLLNAYISIQQNNPLLPPPSSMLVANARGAGVRLPGQDSGDSTSGSGSSSSFSVGNSNFDTTMTPILGVVSKKSEARMFRSYYGIEEYNRALFFAGVPVYAGGVNFGVLAIPGMAGPPVGSPGGAGAPGPPQTQGEASPTPSTTYQRCGEKGEGVMINGVCYGASNKKT